MPRCSDAPSSERLQAAYEIAEWASRDRTVTQAHARDYAGALKVGCNVCVVLSCHTVHLSALHLTECAAHVPGRNACTAAGQAPIANIPPASH